MSSVKPKHSRPTQTALESWVLERFGGAEAKQAISRHAETLVKKTGVTVPPVSVGKLAKVVGIDPWPVYQSGVQGALKIIDGQLRIVLRRSASDRSSTAAFVGRNRFTYAHELGHALFYDLAVRPPVRVAPTGFHRIEEQLCNRAASCFLVPDFLLQTELANVNELSVSVFRALAQQFQTSVQAIAYRIAESFSSRLKPDQFYMLSATGAGYRGTGLEKPRCVVCILGPELEAKKISFLQSNQGIDRIRPQEQQRRSNWSLEEFFQKGKNQNSGSQVKSQEVVECSNGFILELSVCHTTVERSKWVWSEGTIKVLEQRTMRKSPKGP